MSARLWTGGGEGEDRCQRGTRGGAYRGVCLPVSTLPQTPPLAIQSVLTHHILGLGGVIAIPAEAQVPSPWLASFLTVYHFSQPSEPHGLLTAIYTVIICIQAMQYHQQHDLIWVRSSSLSCVVT